MDNKIVEVKFEEGQENAEDFSLKQWSYGHVLQITGLTIPDGDVEVHFSLTENNGSATVHIGIVKDNVITVDIPDYLLAKENTYQPTYDAWAWIYLTDEESGRTVRKITFTVETRAKPTTDVPEDQKDKFLQEIRQVMAETKEIAQSVRADADNGEFDGDKGDAGSIEFKIVAELPTENIDESVMYLLQANEEGDNKFLEYIYVNGAWECIGSASVEVNLDDYVKKDDYASNLKHGVVKVNDAHGLFANSSGNIGIQRPTEAEIDAREHKFKTIVLSMLDYAVMKALSDSKLEWTEEQKQLARALLGSVGSNDIATGSKLGLVQAHANYGVMANGNGLLVIASASKPEIDSKTNSFKPITAEKIDYAVKKALSDCKLSGDDAWTEEEKASALETLGGLPKAENNTAYTYVMYGVDKRGNQVTVPVLEFSASVNTIVMRSAGGVIKTAEPKADADATTKKYVDDRVGSVESILTELHAYAQTKIGGEA